MSNPDIKLAKFAGFCYGVKRAVETAINLKKENPDKNIYILGELIHNTDVINELEKMGIKTINEIPEQGDGICIVRSHGAAPEIFEQIKNAGFELVDLTCPDVKKVQQRAVELAKKYQTEIFPQYRVAYLHGKMKAKEKDEIMKNFKEGEIDILVSTTVIEVGVNVPNANIMVVENADRFGLAQLHQLRGRVGRGQYQSYCVLKYNSKCSQVGKERMKTMQETNDGFVIAEKDLELRGTGEFFGTKQHGIPEFKIANLFVDMPMLKSVQSVALKIESEDKGLTQQKNERLRKIVDNKLKQSVSL